MHVNENWLSQHSTLKILKNLFYSKLMAIFAADKT